jgi:hypothetical protein
MQDDLKASSDFRLRQHSRSTRRALDGRLVTRQRMMTSRMSFRTSHRLFSSNTTEGAIRYQRDFNTPYAEGHSSKG